MPKPDLVKTGIAGLDDVLPGGIPRGNIILVEGAIGTGKTTLGVEFVYRGASQFNEPGIIVVFEVSPDKIMRDALGLGWDLRKLEQQGRVKIVFTTRDVLRQELQQADSVLLEEAASIGARRIFIDGMARLVGGDGTSESRSAFHVLTEGLQRENLTALLAVEASSLSGRPFLSLPEESIADTVIRLRMEDAQRAVSRSIEIVKSEGRTFRWGATLSASWMAGAFTYTAASRRRARRAGTAPLPLTRARGFHPESLVSTRLSTVDTLLAAPPLWPASQVWGRV